jgi:hypothetical protein
MVRHRVVVTFLLGLWLPLVPLSAQAGDAERPNSISVLGGGQIKIAQYSTYLKLGVVYARWLADSSWLDLGTTVLVHRETDWALNGGVRWKFSQSATGVRAFVRTVLEIAVLRRDMGSRFVVGVRGGGGVGYYSSPDFGATVEASICLGPAFGDGVHVASSLDILLGIEFPF